MKWDLVKGNWKNIMGSVKAEWRELTDEDLIIIDGNREKLIGKLQARYGSARDYVEYEVDSWLRRLSGAQKVGTSIHRIEDWTCRKMLQL